MKGFAFYCRATPSMATATPSRLIANHVGVNTRPCTPHGPRFMKIDFQRMGGSWCTEELLPLHPLSCLLVSFKVA